MLYLLNIGGFEPKSYQKRSVYEKLLGQLESEDNNTV